jgi:DnaJ like chaperone protein
MAKLIGFIVGVVAALPIGSRWALVLPVLGLGIGHFIDNAIGFTDPDDPALHERGASRGELDREARATFARFLAALFVCVAEVDGEMTRAEAAAIRAFFDRLGFDAAELQQVRAAIQEARRAPQQLEVALAATRESLNPAERSLLLHALSGLTSVDHVQTPAEQALLLQIAEGLALDADVIHAMLGDAQGTAPDSADDNPYRALGLRDNVTDAALKQAYRALAQKLHPDKVAHLGPRATELAGTAFAQVNLAYEEIRKRRRL